MSSSFSDVSPLNPPVTNARAVHVGKCVGVLLELDPAFTMTALSVFLYCVAHDGCHKQAVEHNLSIQYATSSRVLAYLERLGLVKRQADSENYRRTKVFVTEYGQELFNKLG